MHFFTSTGRWIFDLINSSNDGGGGKKGKEGKGVF